MPTLNKRICLFFVVLFCVFDTREFYGKIVICTASDKLYFDPLINLIGSIHKVNFDELEEISVYDLGMNQYQRQQLQCMEKVVVNQVEHLYPDILTPFKTRNDGKTIPGWFAWKPVIIKQSLDKFPLILYLDAGVTVLNSLNDLFKHIEQNGYFLLGGYHSIGWSTTKFVREKFSLDSPERKYVLNAVTNSANVIGISRIMNDSLTIPMYNLAKDLRYFADDGTTPDGFGTCRHDQTLWSIYTQLLNLKLVPQGWGILLVDGQKIPFHTYWHASQVNPFTTLYLSRWEYAKNDSRPYYEQFIRWKKNISIESQQ